MQDNFFLAPSADARISKAIFSGRKDFSEIFCRNSVWRARASPILRSSPARRAAGARRLNYLTPRGFFQKQGLSGQAESPGWIKTKKSSPARYFQKGAEMEIRIWYNGSGCSEGTWPYGRDLPVKVWPAGKVKPLEPWPDVQFWTKNSSNPDFNASADPPPGPVVRLGLAGG
jgi:hypothetical protein